MTTYRLSHGHAGSAFTGIGAFPLDEFPDDLVPLAEYLRANPDVVDLCVTHKNGTNLVIRKELYPPSFGVTYQFPAVLLDVIEPGTARIVAVAEPLPPVLEPGQVIVAAGLPDELGRYVATVDVDASRGYMDCVYVVEGVGRL